MADNRYIVSDLFKSVFGVNSPIYITEQLSHEKQTFNYSGIEVLPDYYGDGIRTRNQAIDASKNDLLYDIKDDYIMSWMGTPIIFSATLKGGNYKKYKLNGELERVSLNDFTFPGATMFSFRRDKNITVTDVLGDQGTVKEIFGFDDWVIDVRGLCLDEPTISAREQLNELLKREALADAIDVVGSQFTTRNIHKVVIRNWSDNVTQAKAGVISFQCQLLSDTPVELFIP